MRDNNGYLRWQVFMTATDASGQEFEWSIDVRAPAQDDAEVAGRCLYPHASRIHAEKIK